MNYFRIFLDLYRLKKQAVLNRKQIHALQEKKLRQMLHYVWDHSAYYKRTFEAAGIMMNCRFPVSRQQIKKYCWNILTN